MLDSAVARAFFLGILLRSQSSAKRHEPIQLREVWRDESFQEMLF
jgi:hypothetical protein